MSQEKHGNGPAQLFAFKSLFDFVIMKPSSWYGTQLIVVKEWF